MPKFVKFSNSLQDFIYINPVHVTAVTSGDIQNLSSRIYTSCDGSKSFIVDEPPTDVIAKLTSPESI